MHYSNEVTQLNATNILCHHCGALNLCPADTLSTSEQKKFDSITIHDERWGREQQLFWPDEPLHYIYIIHSGSFKTYIENENGDLQVTGFHFQGDVLGLNGMVGGVQRCGAVALETATVCKIPLAEFKKMVSENPTLSYVFINRLSREIMLKQKMLFVLGKMTAEQRLADFLMYMSKESESRGYSHLAFNLRMLRSDIANYLGIAVETVSRTFKDFQSKGIISVDRRKISIENFEALKSLQQFDDTKVAIKAAALS